MDARKSSVQSFTAERSSFVKATNSSVKLTAIHNTSSKSYFTHYKALAKHLTSALMHQKMAERQALVEGMDDRPAADEYRLSTATHAGARQDLSVLISAFPSVAVPQQPHGVDIPIFDQTDPPPVQRGNANRGAYDRQQSVDQPMDQFAVYFRDKFGPFLLHDYIHTRMHKERADLLLSLKPGAGVFKAVDHASKHSLRAKKASQADTRLQKQLSMFVMITVWREAERNGDDDGLRYKTSVFLSDDPLQDSVSVYFHICISLDEDQAKKI